MGGGGGRGSRTWAGSVWAAETRARHRLGVENGKEQRTGKRNGEGRGECSAAGG
jgi:hypothetical protein